jgi:hypothetical protein
MHQHDGSMQRRYWWMLKMYHNVPPKIFGFKSKIKRESWLQFAQHMV